LSYKSSEREDINKWLYRYVDCIFGFPSLVRFTHEKVQREVMSQVICIFWNDILKDGTVLWSVNCENGKDPNEKTNWERDPRQVTLVTELQAKAKRG
jgi:hypothetical protein